MNCAILEGESVLPSRPRVGVANLQTIDRRGLHLHSRGTHEGRAFQRKRK